MMHAPGCTDVYGVRWSVVAWLRLACFSVPPALVSALAFGDTNVVRRRQDCGPLLTGRCLGHQ
jgi:hypothetical protein